MQTLHTLAQPYFQPVDAKRVDVLDGVRVLFVLLVGWYHIWQQSWLTPSFTILGQHFNLYAMMATGYIWVDGMLLLSGFLLFLPFAQSNTRKPDVWPFYKKRLLRIVPSYVLCLVVMLLFVALPQQRYANTSAAVKDMAAHLTFTHTLFPFSYQQTPLNGALWTLGVEMQFYLIFPFVARAFKRWPVFTYAAMAGIALAFRTYARALPDCSMYFNQLPAFLDVYANGFVAAMAFTALHKRSKQHARVDKLFFTAAFAVCVYALMALCKAQVATSGNGVRIGQMDRRFMLSILLSVGMISAAFSLPALRFLLGNRMMRFLSGISFNFYIWHQVFAVQLKAWHIPPYQNPSPNQAGEQPWQLLYTLCCFGGALIIATAVTYLFERPVARWMNKSKK